MQRALLLPAGFAVVVVAALLTTTNDVTAKFTTPLVIALAAAGLAGSLPWRTPRVDGWAAATAAGTYLVYGAPVILSGKATFTGYISLDDTATWLNFTDRLLEHGRTIGGLPVSTYQLNLDFYWNEYGYPVGAFPPLGVVHDIVGTDSAWLIQPYHAFAAAMLALGLYAVVSRLIESRRLRALSAFVAAQPALLYGYSLWGGVKEMVTVALFALTAALTGFSLRKDLSLRALTPLAVASAALVGVLNLGGAVWLAPLLLPALVVLIRRRGRALVRIAAGFVVVLAALSLPALLTAASFANDISLNAKGGDAGNLFHPLSNLQLFGIWPVGDFRLRPGSMGIAYVLIAVVIGAAAAGIVWAVRRRELDLPLFAGAASPAASQRRWWARSGSMRRRSRSPRRPSCLPASVEPPGSCVAGGAWKVPWSRA